MRKNSLILSLIVFLFLFIACSKEDINIGVEKRIQQISTEGYNNNIIRFTYDKYGRVTETKGLLGDGSQINIKYSKNKINLTGYFKLIINGNEPENCNILIIAQLNESGYVTSGVTTLSLDNVEFNTSESWNLEYKNNHLANTTYDSPRSFPSDIICTWEDENLLLVDDVYLGTKTSFEYINGYINKSNLDLNWLIKQTIHGGTLEERLLGLLGFYGKSVKNLPTKSMRVHKTDINEIDEHTYMYEFDKDGFILNCRINQKIKDSGIVEIHKDLEIFIEYQ